MMLKGEIRVFDVGRRTESASLCVMLEGKMELCDVGRKDETA